MLFTNVQKYKQRDPISKSLYKTIELGLIILHLTRPVPMIQRTPGDISICFCDDKKMGVFLRRGAFPEFHLCSRYTLFFVISYLLIIRLGNHTVKLNIFQFRNNSRWCTKVHFFVMFSRGHLSPPTTDKRMQYIYPFSGLAGYFLVL